MKIKCKCGRHIEVNPAKLLGSKTSARKKRSSVANGKLGGRPANCPDCDKPGKFIRVRHFEGGATCKVYMCQTEGCKSHRLYFSVDYPGAPVGQAAVWSE